MQTTTEVTDAARLIGQAHARSAKENAKAGAEWYARQLAGADVPEQLAATLMDRYAQELPADVKPRITNATARKILTETYQAGKAEAHAWQLVEELPGQPPTKRDLENLASSWIPPELANAARLRHVTDQEGRALMGVERSKSSMAGLLIPYVWPGQKRVREYRLRRDCPDIEMKGKERREINKYMSPPGRGNMLFFPPATEPEWLKDPELHIVITEGEKKTLALGRLARMKTAVGFPVRFLAIGLSGVWNWRGTIGKTGGPNGERLNEKGVIPDMDKITWTGRRVVILFDANVRTNEKVAAARKALAEWLTEQGANVHYAEIPAAPGINGIDDYLAAHGEARGFNLIHRARKCGLKPPAPAAPAPVQQPQEESDPYLASAEDYRLSKKGLWLVRWRAGDVQTIKLTNFPAVITADVWRDDGETRTHALKIHATVGGRSRDIVITASEFAEMRWPLEELGTKAVVYPGNMNAIQAAMQLLSKEVKEETVYQHIGWTEIEAQNVYLHAGGAIGARGALPSLLVEIDPALRHYSLPAPPSGRELRRAIEASLGFLNCAPDRVVLPIYAAIWRAVLGSCDVSLHLSGQTGNGKSELAALAQQHFGASMTAKHLPASWDSTANALQALCFFSKDALITVDDFVPKGTPSDVARLHQQADRLLRSQGNGAGRQRMRADATIRPPRTPRGLILSTGEDVPKGHSLRARLVVLEMDPADMRWKTVTQCQKAAADGLYASAMAGFLQWVAPRMGEMPRRIYAELANYRSKFEAKAAHARTPDNLANLNVGLEVFMEFAHAAGVMTRREVDELRERTTSALADAAEAQRKAEGNNEPTGQFIELIRAALSSGRAYLAATDGACPAQPSAAGWKKRDSTWYAEGPKIGWIDEDHVYLDPVAAFGAAQHMGQSVSDPITVSRQTLGRRLKQRGLLASTEEKRETVTIRKSVEGRRQEVWHFRRGTLYAE